MIRKPGAEEFRENQAIVAMRETRKVAVEGSRGIGKGMARLYVTFIGLMMAFGFVMSAIPFLGGFGLLFALVGAGWFFRQRSEKARAARHALEDAAYHAGPGYAAPMARGVALPPGVRREGFVELDIGQVAQQATVLFLAGFIVLFLFARSDEGLVGTLLGIALVMLAVLVGARLVGSRRALEWDSETVTAHHLLGAARMAWGDVTRIEIEHGSRLDLATYALSGSSRNLAISGPRNRLGGSRRLLMPLRLTAIDDAALEALLRDFYCWQAVGHAEDIEPAGPAPHRPFQARPPQLEAQAHGYTLPPCDHDEPADGSSYRGGDGFDPDAIIERYMRERAQLQVAEAASREAVQRPATEPRRPIAAPASIAARRLGGFGRKGL